VVGTGLSKKVAHCAWNSVIRGVQPNMILDVPSVHGPLPANTQANSLAHREIKTTSGLRQKGAVSLFQQRERFIWAAVQAGRC
jgi:hypothetical protein